MSRFVLDESLPTPRLQICGELVRGNVQRMSDYAGQHGLQLRPHTKTHKSLHVARMQLAAGACGLTVAKVGEAEVMAAVCNDLLIAYPTVDTYRCRRVAELAGRVTTRVALDSVYAAEALSRAAQQRGTTVGILVDVDFGYGRTGVQSDAEAIRLGQTVERLPALRLDGIMTYTGHILGSDAEQTLAFEQLSTRLDKLLDAWRRSSLCADIISSGSTPAAFHCHLARQITEIRPGTYVYNDLNTLRGGYVSLDACAARIVATVVSDAVANQVVLDSGSKTLTSDLCGPAPHSGYGLIVEYPQAKIARLTEEHAQVDVSSCAARPRVGQQVTIVPNHICVCVNMQTDVWWQEADQIPQSLRVDARGLLT